MIFGGLAALWQNRAKRAATPSRDHIVLRDSPVLIYAIGDVHGRLDLLRALEAEIRADGDMVQGPKLIIQLGDLVDRGPHSAQVIDHMLSRAGSGWQRLAVAGNHETTFCDALEDHKLFETWLGFGGVETLGSYGIGQRELRSALGKSRRVSELVQAYVPSEHLEFLRRLPISITTGNLTFVHAGGRPGIPFEEQDDRDLLWYTGPRDDVRSDGRIIVHGHEIVKKPEMFRGRINVDTGAYASGILSAVRLGLDAPPRIIQVSSKGS